jgi:5-methylcytosine-specific restriction endonuclease McrA
MLTLEHLTPLSRGGTWEAGNLDVSCYRCNSSKASLTDAEFRELGPVVRWKEGSGKAADEFVKWRKKQRRESAAAAGNQPVSRKRSA